MQLFFSCMSVCQHKYLISDVLTAYGITVELPTHRFNYNWMCYFPDFGFELFLVSCFMQDHAF